MTQNRAAPASGTSAPDVDPRRSDPFGAIGDVGSAFVVALSLFVGVVVALGWLGLHPLNAGPPGSLTLGFAALAGVLTWLCLHRARSAVSAPRLWTIWVPAGPALVLIGYLAVSRLLPLPRRTEWLLGGDHVRHLIMMAEAQNSGSLSYTDYAYPRGWHAFVAAVWSTAGISPRDDFSTVVDVTSALVWALSVLLAFTTACLASTLSARLGLSVRAAGLAGCLAGAATLLPWFLGNYQSLGLETSLLGAVLLAVVIRTQLARPDGVPALVVAGASIALLAHTWQLLLPVVALAALRSGLTVSRRHGPRGLAGAGALAAAVVVVAWPALVAVVTVVGVDHATDAGVEVPVPWLVLVLGVSAAVGASLRLSWSGRWALMLMLVPAVTGLALAAWVGIAPTKYYPSKLIWHSAVLLLAPLAAAVVVGVRALHVRRPRARFARIVGGVVAACALLYVLVQPAAAFAGVWSTADGRMLFRLIETPGAAQAQVVWSGAGEGTDTLTRSFLDVVRSEPGPLRTPQAVLTVAQECALLDAAEVPTVLTVMPEAQVRSRYACSPTATILRPSG